MLPSKQYSTLFHPKIKDIHEKKNNGRKKICAKKTLIERKWNVFCVENDVALQMKIDKFENFNLCAFPTEMCELRHVFLTYLKQLNNFIWTIPSARKEMSRFVEKNNRSLKIIWVRQTSLSNSHSLSVVHQKTTIYFNVFHLIWKYWRHTICNPISMCEICGFSHNTRKIAQ